MAPAHLASYLSGQVIGTEIAHARAGNPQDADYVVLASEEIGGRYVKAMRIAGLKARTGDANSIVKGLARIARKAGLIA
jgi:2-keto-3-deoxy-galactonokinase